MNTRLALGGLAVGAVLLVAWSLATSDAREPEAMTGVPAPARSASMDEALARDIALLRAQLALEVSARRELEGQLAALRAQLAARGAIAAEAPTTAFPVPTGPQPVAGSSATPFVGAPGGVGPEVSFAAAAKRPPANSVVSFGEKAQGVAPGASWLGAPQAVAAASPAALPEPASETPSPDASGEEPVFDTEALVDQVGLHPDEASELREYWEQFSLDRLALVDRANREGWRYKPKFRREARRLESEVLGELGEERFDQLLYASGRSNRVVVRDVLEYSTAEHAGLEPGDIIMRYNDRAIFDSRQLQVATAGGELGESVRLELLRGGERVIVDVERGPLGTLLRASHESPDLY